MGQQAGGYVPDPNIMQMQGMDMVPAQPVAMAETVKEEYVLKNAECICYL